MNWLALLSSRWLHYAALALLLLAAWSSRNHWHHAYLNERTAHQTDIASYRTAQAEAVALAMAQKRALEAHFSAEKEKSDAELTQALKGAENASERYRLAHQCVRVEAAPGSRRSADLPRPAADPGEPRQPSGSAELVGISRADFDACTANTLRLQNAHEWAKALAP